jgi:hypothetical protein
LEAMQAKVPEKEVKYLGIYMTGRTRGRGDPTHAMLE